MKLNIGAGKTKRTGFLSIDAFNPDADITAPSWDTGIAVNTVSEIFCSHMLEHLQDTELDTTLIHWKKILQENGKITALVPNATLYLSEWLNAAEEKRWSHLEEWGGKWIMGFNNKGKGMWHRQLFHVETFRRLFKVHGFKIEICKAVETRVKNKQHFEYRENGDIICIAIK